MKRTSEGYLREVTVGELKPLNGTVFLAPYDARWASQYERLAFRIRNALGERVLLLEHVGSTSVPGLSAKPIIDMVLAVPDSADEAAAREWKHRQHYADAKTDVIRAILGDAHDQAGNSQGQA
jgi:GrpB-like predicted nucleotidyltransferase (UPF0157 family)